MQWFVANWFWILVGGLFIAMHLFGHGGHGGHGGGSRPPRGDEGEAGDPPAAGATSRSGGHQH